jgi:AcrR family transcriptional regulator
VKKRVDIQRTRSEGKREQMIEAGRRVIFREGIWATTTRKIADEASINLATIHYHFANKDALLVAVYDEMLDALRVQVRRDFPEPSTLAARIERVMQRTWEYSKENMAGQLMQAELTLYALRSGLADLAERQSQEYLEIYLRVFRGASDVAGCTGLDIDGLSRMLIAGTDGILIQHYAEPDNARSAAACEKLAYLAQRYPLTPPPDALTALSLSSARGGGKRRIVDASRSSTAKKTAKR